MWNTRRYSYEDRDRDGDNDSCGYPSETASPHKVRMRNKRHRRTNKRVVLAAGGGLCVLALAAVLVPVIIILFHRKEGDFFFISSVSIFLFKSPLSMVLSAKKRERRIIRANSNFIFFLLCLNCTLSRF